MTSESQAGSTTRTWRAAAAGTLFFAVAVGWLISRRTALTMDERHTLLVAQAIASGDAVSFYVGSVTRYEGGSWLIAWPVALLLKLGAYGTAATSWTAAAISIGSVAAGSVWLGRHRGAFAALSLGPVCALAFPEGMHYSYRAWGSLAEALVMLPVLALLHDRWTRLGRSHAGAVGLGLALAFALVLSYFHFITALTFVVVEGTQARDRSVKAVAVGVGLTLGACAVAFLAWVFLANPYPGEAWVVRDGRSLASTVKDLLLPRLDLVILSLPGAVQGEITESSAVRMLASLGILVAAALGAARAWSRPPMRPLVVFAVLFIPALGVGHSLLDPPAVYRYYLPLLAVSAALIAGGGPAPVLLAIVCGAAFWLPSGLAMPYQNPAYTVLELGSNAMHRYSPDPHIKFKLLRSHIPTWHRRWFAFGYGVDSGRRCSPTRAGSAGGPVTSPLGALHSPESWAGFWSDLFAPEEEADFLFGLGTGFAADGQLDAWETEVLDTLSPPHRGEVLLGIGAAIGRSLDAEGPDRGRAIGAALLMGLGPPDLEHVGRGIASTAAAGRPDGADMGLQPESTAGLSLEQGLGAEVDRARRAMSRVPTVPTPHPP